MKTVIKTNTKTGMTSIIFSSIAILLFVVIILGAMSLDVTLLTNVEASFFGNKPLAFLSIGAMISLILSFITGLFSVMRLKEKSLFVYLSISIGALVLFVGITEIF